MPSIVELAAEKLREILTRMGVEGEVVVHEEPERVVLEVRGVDTGLIIGRQGATLDALQYLVNRMVGPLERDDAKKLITIDAEGYRERRTEALVELAHRLADKARRNRKPVAAQPMSAADRRVMHVALADLPDVTTHSEGEGPERRIVVVPVAAAGQTARVRADRDARTEK